MKTNPNAPDPAEALDEARKSLSTAHRALNNQMRMKMHTATELERLELMVRASVDELWGVVDGIRWAYEEAGHQEKASELRELLGRLR